MNAKTNQEPVTADTVTVPTVMLLITTLPLGLIMTGKLRAVETVVPRTRKTLRKLDEPLAAPPDVPTFSVQGSILMT